MGFSITERLGFLLPPAKFDPANALHRDAEADAVVRYAQRVLAWPMLERAIEQKLDDQAEFVAWWDASVGDKPGPGRGKKGQKPSPDPGRVFLADAEKLSGIKNQQVSRWRPSGRQSKPTGNA